MGDEPTVVLVVPIAPAATGNGLAMRAGALLDALAEAAAVHVVVVPVSGSVEPTEWLSTRARSVTAVDPVTADTERHHMTRQLADPDLRARLTATAPLPGRAALAPPTLADAAIGSLVVDTPTAVLAMRSYLAPLGVWLAERLGAGRTVIDADEDDGPLLRALGDTEEADAFDRLARCWLPRADVVTVASPDDAASMTARLGVDVDVIANVVRVPESVPPPPGADRLVYVGNLTYAPNVEAAQLLAYEIVPRVRQTRPDTMLDLVGAHDGLLRGLEGPGIRVTGPVPDVAPFYANADVVVVPLRHGGGTRIKVLEAFAHRRPVVATRRAVAGLDVGHDDVVIGESVDELADGVVEVLTDPSRATRQVDHAVELVNTRYTAAVVGPRLRAIVLGPAA